MKLYNLYNEIILEEIREQISEAVSTSAIDAVLDGDPDKPGKHYKVDINYTNEKGENSNQFIMINQRNLSSRKGAKPETGLIDAMSVSRNNEVLGDGEYKKFRLDRINSFKVSKVPYYKAGSKFKTNGTNNSRAVASVEKSAEYGFTPATPKPIKTPVQKEPIQQPKPVKKSAVRPMKRIPVKQPTNKNNQELQNPDIEASEENSELNK
jgi:hypothetical protein